ncbi:HYR domain-containing protein, partial [Flavobacterium sp. DGU11]
MLDYVSASAIAPSAGMALNKNAATTTFAGCTTGSQYPDQIFTPTCTGAAQTINTDAWAGEYAAVIVTSNTQYTFSSSTATDYITISDSGGTTILASGISPLAWNAGANSGSIRYYIHKNASCTVENVSRIRYILCNGCSTPAPSAVAQSFCNSATVANLVATGTVLKWYTASTGGTQLAGTTALGTGTYYVSQTLNSCEGARTSVAVTLNVTPAPTGVTSQVYAGTGTIANLSAIGTTVQWYAAATGGSPLVTTTALTDGTTYYASQTINGCESPSRLAVTVINISQAAQVFCASQAPIIASLAATPATGTIVKWFAAISDGTPLGSVSTLVTGNYYAAQVKPGIVSTFAGSTQGFANGNAADATFNNPRSIVIDNAGNYYIVDSENSAIRRITPGGIVSTLAGGTLGNANGTGTNAGFQQPAGMDIDANGNLYLADQSNHTIRKITPAGVVTTLAGAYAGFNNGTGSNALFNFPTDVAVDANGNVYVVDQGNNAIRKITPGGVVTTLAGGTQGSANGTGTAAQFYFPRQLAFDADGNIIVADTNNNLLRKVTPSGVVTTFAGTNGSGYVDGPLSSAKFGQLQVLQNDTAGNLFIYDSNARIRKITPSGIVSTIAGSNMGSFADGAPDTAQFNFPDGLAINPDGTIYVADRFNHRIRKVAPDSESNRVAVQVTVNNTPVPVAGPQSFCVAGTVAGLAATGTDIKWYDAPTGGMPLSASTALLTGIYYATQTIDGCESARKAVAVSISDPVITVPATITVCANELVTYDVSVNNEVFVTQNTTQNQLTYSGLCGNGGDAVYRIFDLNALGYSNGITLSSVVFNGGSTNGEATFSAYTLSGPLLLQNLTLLGNTTFPVGSSFSSHTVPMGDIMVPANSILVIAVSSPDTLLFGYNSDGESATGYLKADACGYTEPVPFGPGINLLLSFNAINGTTLSLDSGLPSGSLFPVGTTTVTYTAASAAGCTAAASFDVVVNPATLAPVASDQIFCNAAIVFDLQATGTDIKWYDVATDGTPLLANTPLETGNYYVTQTLNGCESQRLEVHITVNDTPAPLAAAQSFCGTATVGQLVATGTDIKWYDTTTGGISLDASTVLTSGNYFVTQTLNDCESAMTAVAVTINGFPVITVPATITACANEVVNYSIEAAIVPADGGLLTQTASRMPLPQHGISCPSSDNTYLRVFDLQAMGYSDGLLLDTINFAVEQNLATQNVTVTAYTLSGPFIMDNLTILGSTTIAVNTAPNVLYSAPMGGITVPGNSTLVIAFSVDAGTSFYPGGTNAAQTGASYIRTVGCNLPEPTDLANIGFGYAHTILDFNARPLAPPVLTLEAGLPSGSVFPVGTTTVTYNAATAAGCEATASFDVIVNPEVAAPVAANQVFCNAATVADLEITGENIQWYHGVTAIDSTEPLGSGTYFATQTVNGCVSAYTQINVTVAEPLILTPYTYNDVACHGDNTGSATVYATGGLDPLATPTEMADYMYSWAPYGGNGATATGLAAGTYTVTVTSAAGCTATQSFIIGEPDVLTALIVDQGNVLCNGEATGWATALADGGSVMYDAGTGLPDPYSYSYEWNTVPVQFTATATGLAAGTYIVTIADANSCSTTKSVTITQPNVLAATTTQTNVSCFNGTNGSATVTPTGGTGTYTYSWNTIPAQTLATVNGLSAGTYIVNITDANSCSITKTVTITQPNVLTATTTQTNISCFNGTNGSSTVTPTGGTGNYSYSWNTIPVQTTATATGLAAGTYIVNITDANSCSTTKSVTITQPNVLAATTTQTNVSCFNGTNGSATVTATGGTGAYSYSWTTVPVKTTATATGLAAGTYIVTITDANSCSTTKSVTITQPNVLAATTTQTNVSCFNGTNGSATVTPTGGTGAYSYSWNTVPVQVSATANGLSAGTYVVTIMDANSCSITKSVTITQPNVLAATTTQTNVSCFNGTNGSATVTATGGTGAYSYSWTTVPVKTTATATGLAAGTYIV